MGMFFCDGCQRHRESREHGFNEVASRQLCDNCEFEREEALSQFKAECMQAHVEATENRRNVH